MDRTDAGCISKPMPSGQGDDFCAAAQCIQSQITARVSAQPVHQHHLGQAGLKTDNSTMLNLLQAISLVMVQTELRGQTAQDFELDGHTISNLAR